MRDVAIIGVGANPKWGELWGQSLRDIFVEAALAAMDDAGVDHIDSMYVGCMSSGIFAGQEHIGSLLADYLGQPHVPATRVETACASGGAAVKMAALEVASGHSDVVLAGGVEKMTDVGGGDATYALGTAADAEYECYHGATFPGLYAMIARAHMDRYGTTPEMLAQVAVKNHDNGALNAKAQFGASIRQVMAQKVARAQAKGRPVPTWADEMDFLHDDRANPVIAWPMRLFDCSPISDGAAAVLLVAEEMVKSFTDDPIYVIGSGQASDAGLHDRPDLTSIGAARFAGQRAYEMAGVSPDDIKLAEVHDCFTIAEIMAIEDLSFFAAGRGYRAAEEGLTARTGPKPVNTSGGLKSKGHPVGASGAGQVIEIWKQMRGEAGARQVSGDVDLALTHNVGGTGQTCVVHIYERR